MIRSMYRHVAATLMVAVSAHTPMAAYGWSREKVTISVTPGMPHANAIRQCAAAANASVVIDPGFEKITFKQSFTIADVDPLDLACIFAWEPGFTMRYKVSSMSQLRNPDEILFTEQEKPRPYVGQEWHVIALEPSKSARLGGCRAMTDAHFKYLHAISPYPKNWTGNQKAAAILNEVLDETR